MEFRFSIDLNINISTINKLRQHSLFYVIFNKFRTNIFLMLYIDYQLFKVVFTNCYLYFPIRKEIINPLSICVYLFGY